MSSVQDVINPITIENYERGWFSDGVSQHNPIFKALMAKGNIKRNVNGTALTWNVKAGRHDVNIVDDDEDVGAKYTPRKRFAQATSSWGQIASFRRLSKGQLRQNGGEEALVKFRDEEIPDMFEDLITANNGLGWQFLNQNSTTYAGTGLPMDGLPTLFGSVAWAAGSKEGTVTGSYAGLPMTLGAINVDGAETDAWSPTAINTTSTAWAGGAGANATFRYNAFEILSYAHTKASRFSTSPDQSPSGFMLASSMFIDLGTQLREKQSFLLTGKVGKGQSFGIGTDTKMLHHDGLEVTWDENMPANTGYCLNFSQIDLCQQPLIAISGDKSPLKSAGQYKPLFETEVTYSDDRRGVKVSATFPGQFRFRNPRYQVQLFAGA